MLRCHDLVASSLAETFYYWFYADGWDRFIINSNMAELPCLLGRDTLVLS